MTSPCCGVCIKPLLPQASSSVRTENYFTVDSASPMRRRQGFGMFAHSGVSIPQSNSPATALILLHSSRCHRLKVEFEAGITAPVPHVVA